MLSRNVSVPIVRGIFTAEDAYARIRAGASRRISGGLAACCAAGLTLRDAIGRDAGVVAAATARVT